MPVGHKTCTRQFLECEEDSGGMVRFGWGGNLQKSEVGIWGFGSLEEGGSGLWGVIEEARGVSEHAPALRPN